MMSRCGWHGSWTAASTHRRCSCTHPKSQRWRRRISWKISCRWCTSASWSSLRVESRQTSLVASHTIWRAMRQPKIRRSCWGTWSWQFSQRPRSLPSNPGLFQSVKRTSSCSTNIFGCAARLPRSRISAVAYFSRYPSPGSRFTWWSNTWRFWIPCIPTY